MSRPLRLPAPETTLHLYRHLLREASYLPPLARPWVDQQIRGRFRQHIGDEEDEASKRIRAANHELRCLRAANAGDMVRMRRVLLHSFGRLGRRRRQLMAELLQHDVPTNTEELKEYAAKAALHLVENRKLDWLDSWNIEKLRTFARSQAEASLHNPPRPAITSNQTVPSKYLPSEDSWGRPLPPLLARTKIKKLWKTVADKCMPPLPKEEWEQLRDIALGKTPGPEFVPPPRRPVARSIVGGGQDGRPWNWQAYAVRPVNLVDRPANRRSKLLSGAVDDNTPTGDPEPLNCHKYTERLWRRLLTSIWQLTAFMEPKPTGKGWNIVWGKPEFRVSPATAGDMEFFTDFPSVEEVQPRGKKANKK
ncbi:hypothetical protein VTK26DRAFT_483 [Humicola hyalothermophila]